MKKENLFHISGNGTRESEVFETLLKTGDLLVERIISHGQATATGEWYDQDQDEWVVLLTGKASIRFSPGEIIELLPGDYLFIPAHQRHRVESASADPECIWLAIHGKLKN